MRSLIILTVISTALAKNFLGCSVYKLWPSTKEQVDIVRSLESGYDVWAEYSSVRGWSQVMVQPEQKKIFFNLMKKSEIIIETSIPDVQSLIDKNEAKSSTKHEINTKKMGWDRYHPLDEINTWLESLPQAYPDNVEIINGGKSFEGRPLLGIKLSFGRSNRSAVFEGGIHAREWISPATVTYIINEFLTSTDLNIRDLAESFTWHIFPVINPDGYVYTFNATDGNRLWRKNRSTLYTCFGETAGVDLNRNFDSNWMEVGASLDPCAEIHAGSHAFSEPETSSYSRYVSAVPNLDIYLTFHSYSQVLIIPYGHTTQFLDNYADVFEIGVRAADAIYTRFNTTYEVGISADILYMVSGGSRDWAKGQLRVPIVWTYELRDKGEFGFLLPEDQIVPNNLEVMDSLISLLNTGRNLYYFDRPNRADSIKLP